MGDAGKITVDGVLSFRTTEVQIQAFGERAMAWISKRANAPGAVVSVTVMKSMAGAWIEAAKEAGFTVVLS